MSHTQMACRAAHKTWSHLRSAHKCIIKCTILSIMIGYQCAEYQSGCALCLWNQALHSTTTSGALAWLMDDKRMDLQSSR